MQSERAKIVLVLARIAAALLWAGQHRPPTRSYREILARLKLLTGENTRPPHANKFPALRVQEPAFTRREIRARW